jgi:hypothetical protein
MTTNRRILVDNATLTGVERITGVSQTLNLNNIDNDILCLEKLVTAILFSDVLLGVDDYKDQFRSNRLKRFAYIDFLDLGASVYQSLANDAADFARSMTFSFDGSKPAGDVVAFFEALRINPQMRWDVWVSSEYLTLSYLVSDTKNVGYETSIDSVFRNEEADGRGVALETDHHPSIGITGRDDIKGVKDLVHAFSSGNSSYRGEEGKSALDRMVFGYGWAAERSHFYNAVAGAYEADAFLAPLRDAFCESCCRIDHPSQYSGLLDALKGESRAALKSILEPSGQAKFAMRLPFFVAYLISKTDNPKQCIDLALNLRNTPDFHDCRTIFHNLNHLSGSGRTKELNGILQYLSQSCENLMKKYAVATANGPQMSVSIGVTGPNLGFGAKIDQLFRSYKNRPFTRVFRNIAQDMLNVERLGALYDKVRSSVREHPEAQYPKISTTPDFMEGRESPHGRPARL